jgi:predicted transposase/invertase (TIGR01784 family)
LFREKLAKNEQEIMRTIANKIEQRGMQQGMQKGMLQEKLAIAKSMLQHGLDTQLIQEVTNLSRETIEALKK